ncbi:YqeG family HAD IIIA-type phosphatase [Zhaonella formicivorans]|jgi:hypothetical protein|uniref:YqeG family HAD IIIA-type phosphatase n=1 Tax=Zhaonella formicivorans TaxID=2528593 RepID=UPI0010D09AAD|nr:YqeG family HAD IIIA-type phosphatase [Zhaonella formicivorans]
MSAKSILQPSLYVETLLHIPLAELAARGIKGLIIDLDNTITEWNSPELKEEVSAWFKSLAGYELRACIASNNSRDRVEQIGRSLGIPAIHKAGKPRRKAFRQAMNVLGTNQHTTAVIGDQIFTDILGGNRLGMYTILVSPLNPREFIGTRLVRKLERLVLKKYFNKGDRYEGNYK